MTKSKKIKDANYQKTENLFLCVFINDFVKKFRSYNNDEFIISISGLKGFITKNDTALTNLFDKLKENKFTIEFEENEESINHLEICCKNITKDSFSNFEYKIQNLPTIVDLSVKTDIPPVGIIIIQIVAQIISKSKILYKAIVLDLDDTLWNGTLSEVGIDKINGNLHSEEGTPFITFMKFVKTLANELGIFITICSRNDSKMVESAIHKLDENIFPIRNQIDYIIANYNDKSKNIKLIAEQLSILPNSIVFIDDNQIVRDEVKLKLPEVFVPEWSNHSELVTQLIAGCIFERDELSLNSQNRRKQYRIIQTERTQNTLPKLSVKVIKDEKHTESIKLYSKSNQFKFSRNNDFFDSDAKSLYFEIHRENGENLGICSAITYTISNDTFLIHNWGISCRYFGIGLEEFILLYIQKNTNANKIFINYHNTEYNQKVRELLVKYSDAFMNNDKNDKFEIIVSKEIADKMDDNTNLREL
ncbi:HAD-superfamily phosphatase, subfamily IIIC/FkbH-like domain-containing protein [Tangfeifania diversioriginum]|uniref:HAD-superfamily phosphatase, subfamily IIIC/FkbH-like domain-containing protein n=1 Tax=Tangfeifania diversioriginum TaxID=1168035 RepID=A0A1M6CKJ8_9BACT|nr:HAD-IIIC family phosphatase [Tangfeifania diversioriginum]SHI61545.1 HAD-superfamily phosphatase, subfamily IIIC/FkbH-like domain-containing protein [Tangfeifania diversioriginum]